MYLTLFAMGEALRTGSHKAIMLNHLDSSGQADSLGSLGARISPNIERRSGDRRFALNRVYSGAVLAVSALTLCVLHLKSGLLPALLVLSVLTVLQNVHRPIFVSALNTQTVQTDRASILSLESVARVVTILIPLFGLAADHFELMTVWLLSFLILLSGLLFPVRHERFAGGTHFSSRFIAPATPRVTSVMRA